MIINISTIFCIIAILAFPIMRPLTALMVVALSSFLGTYAFGFEDGVRILPGPVVAIAYCIWLGMQTLLGMKWRIHKSGLMWLWFLMVYATIVTVLAPIVFGGSISVIRPGLIEQEVRWTVPLAFTSSTLAQIVYLWLSFILLLKAITEAKKERFELSKTFKFHYLFAVIISIGILIETVLGSIGAKVDIYAWLMGDSFLSLRSDRYALSSIFGLDIHRAQAVFGEPSFFSSYMIGIWGGLIVSARNSPSLGKIYGLGLILVSTLLGFSTTGAIGIALVGLMALLVPLPENGSSRSSNSSLSRVIRKLFIIGIVVLSAMLFTVLLSDDSIFNYLFGKLSDTEGYESGNYSSGAERQYWNIVALRAVFDSYGIGIGAGGTRASSFFINFVAAYGIPGAVIMLFGTIHLMRLLYKKSGYADNSDVKVSIMIFIGWMVGFFASVPDGMSFFYIWIHLGFVISTLYIRKKLAAREG
ncbi:hypothetical protein ABRQ01_06810 [Pectobacterium aroidearum]|uniref:hypothetical protein n=1 Tax=Pectobacterium aroidearum TaxID=1201031 RepID=UPI0032EC4389